MNLTKKFLFFFPLKFGAWIMAFTNLAFAIIFIIGGSIGISNKNTMEDDLYLIMGILMGIFNLFTGILLLVAIGKGKENIVLIYLILELTNLMILTIFAIFNMFKYRSIILGELFLACIALWFGMFSMFGYYLEMAEYNSVKSGAIEITCNPHINPLMGLPEKAIESTPV